MTGPYHFGTTANVNGIWAIFYRLNIIVKWGITDFKAWFKDHVVASARRYCDEEGTDNEEVEEDEI